jgi:hypothetical protein
VVGSVRDATPILTSRAVVDVARVLRLQGCAGRSVRPGLVWSRSSTSASHRECNVGALGALQSSDDRCTWSKRRVKSTGCTCICSCIGASVLLSVHMPEGKRESEAVGQIGRSWHHVRCPGATDDVVLGEQPSGRRSPGRAPLDPVTGDVPDAWRGGQRHRATPPRREVAVVPPGHSPGVATVRPGAARGLFAAAASPRLAVSIRSWRGAAEGQRDSPEMPGFLM